MFTKHVSIMFAAGVLLLGIAGMAQAENNEKTVRLQEQVRITKQHTAQVRTVNPEEKGSANEAMTQERTQTRERSQTWVRSKEEAGERDPDRLRDQDRDRDRLKNGTGDHDPDQLQNHDRIHDHLGAETGGMGGGMRGPRK